MTAAQLAIEPRPTAVCPRCGAEHCLTRDGRLWTHGPRDRRCRGSRLRPHVARALGRVRRRIETVHLPEED